jgi:hypothetical protein
MTTLDHLVRDTGSTVQLVFACDEPFTLDALQTLVARHAEQIERLPHTASARVHAGNAPTLELSLSIEGATPRGPACELEALTAVHDLELRFAAEGFVLRQLRRAA